MSVNALVLRKFRINSEPAADLIIDIQGRKSGFAAFVLTILQLDSTTALRCFKDRVEYKSSSLFGEASITMPLSQITGIVGGYKKPIESLIVAFILFILGVTIQFTTRGVGTYIAFLFAIIIPIFLIIQYSYGKTMNIGVQNGGDKIYGLEFKKGLIEGIEVDVKLVRESINLLNEAVLKS